MTSHYSNTQHYLTFPRLFVRRPHPPLLIHAPCTHPFPTLPNLVVIDIHVLNCPLISFPLAPSAPELHLPQQQQQPKTEQKTTKVVYAYSGYKQLEDGKKVDEQDLK